MFVALNGGWIWDLASDGAIPKLPVRNQCPRGKLLSVPCAYFSGKPHHFSKIGQICLILSSKPRVVTLPGHGPETWLSPGVVSSSDYQSWWMSSWAPLCLRWDNSLWHCFLTGLHPGHPCGIHFYLLPPFSCLTSPTFLLVFWGLPLK